MRPPRPWVVVLAVLAGGVAGVRGYYIADPTRIWPDGNIQVHEQLTSSATMIDGSASLNVAFENALQTWNQYLGRIQMVPVRGSTVSPGDGDDVNNIVLAGDVFGRPFDAGILASTVRWYDARTNQRTEFDVVFNSAYTWNSYRGSQRAGVQDLFRIALHQIGLGLGLNAPDANGQTVEAIMNVEDGDLDTLAFDDIAAAAALYSSASSAPVPSSASLVTQFTAQTDADGIATFAPTGGRPVPVRFADQDTGEAIPGANAYLFADPNGIAVVAMVDPYRRYFTQMAPIRLPLIVATATAPAGVRPIEVPVPVVTPQAGQTTMSVVADSIARAAMDAWIPVQQRAVDFLNAAASNGFIVDKEIRLDELTDVTMSGYLGGESRDRSLGLMVEARGYSDTLLWKGFERAGTATAIRDGFWNFVRFGLTERGYREDQQFRVRVARILPVNTPAFIQNFNEWQIYVSPMEVPRGDPPCEVLGVGCPAPGVLSGRLYDVTSGAPLGGVIKLNGTSEVLLFAGSSGLYASRPIAPGLYSLTALSRDYRSLSVTLEVEGDGKNNIRDLGLTPVGIRTITVEPAAQAITDTQVTSFRATALRADRLPYSPTPRFIWHSDNPAVATIDPESGGIRAVRAGVAHITAQAGQRTSNVATLTVERSAPCTYAVAPSGYTATAAGGTGTFTVAADADCTWLSASQASYITITSSTAGTPGNGGVRFSVAANTSTSQRVGSLLIATKTVTITQSGATSTTPTPTPPPSGSGRYDGTYDFTFAHPVQGGQSSRTLSRFFVVTSGRISSSDGTVAGSVTDTDTGSVRFTGPCWDSSGGTATWVGALTASSPKAGQGTYTCQNNIIGGTWSVTNGR